MVSASWVRPGPAQRDVAWQDTAERLSRQIRHAARSCDARGDAARTRREKEEHISRAENLQSEFVAFWNDTLATTFERYRKILMSGLAEERRDEVEAALRAALAPCQQGGGIVMPSGSWRVSARKPG